MTTLRRVHDDWMQLPHQPVVFSNRADPTDYGAIRVKRDAADAICAE